MHQDWIFLGATDLEATADIVPQGQNHFVAHTEGLLTADLGGEDLLWE